MGEEGGNGRKKGVTCQHLIALTSGEVCPFSTGIQTHLVIYEISTG